MAGGFSDALDSDGVSHRIYKQEEAMSCALACLFMIENQYEQSTHIGGETRLKKISFAFPDSLLESQLKGDNLGIGTGTDVANTQQVLPVIGVSGKGPYAFAAWSDVQINGQWVLELSKYVYGLDKKLIRDRRPALLLVAWLVKRAGKWLRNGGHFIVAPRVTRKGTLVVLDPSDATLHELHGNAGVYRRNGSYGLITHVIYTI